MGPEAVAPCTSTYNPVVVRLLSGAGALCLAGVTYLLGRHQKKEDRKSDFFKDTVLTPCTTELSKFFDDYREKFKALAKVPTKGNGGSTAPRGITKLHREFSEDLYAVRNFITSRLETFDQDAEALLEDLIDEVDTDITSAMFKLGSRDFDRIDESLKTAKKKMMQILWGANKDIFS